MRNGIQIYIYNKMKLIASLQMEDDLSVYLNKLNLFLPDNLVILSTKDGEIFGLSDLEISSIGEFGLNLDKHRKGDSYIAVINKGAVTYEATSNNRLYYFSGNDDFDVTIVSSGYDIDTGNMIRIEGVDYSANSSGLNIVVYDVELKRVIDTVGFDFIEEKCVRPGSIIYWFRDIENDYMNNAMPFSW